MKTNTPNATAPNAHTAMRIARVENKLAIALVSSSRLLLMRSFHSDMRAPFGGCRAGPIPGPVTIPLCGAGQSRSAGKSRAGMRNGPADPFGVAGEGMFVPVRVLTVFGSRAPTPDRSDATRQSCGETCLLASG